MYFQALDKFFLGNVTTLAFMSIACACAACLTFPVRTVIGFKTTAPDWVMFSIPVLGFPFTKTRRIAEVVFIPLDSIRFSFKASTTAIAVHDNSLVWALLYSFSIPTAATLAITEIVWLHSAWRNTFSFATPGAFNICRWALAFIATIMFLRSPCVPVGTLKGLFASFAFYCNHSISVP